jgi:glycine/D-amino acid oxidase-like deaminating enzyme
MTAPRPRSDAIIVGGGIVGAACAEALTRDGWSVLVLEQEMAGGGATAAAMGHLVVMDDSPAQLALTAYSRALWRERMAELPPAMELLDCGTLWLATDDAQMSTVRAKRDAYRAAGLEAADIDGDELARLEPALRPGLAGALRVPDDAVVYPPAAARWLLDAAMARGARLREGVRVTAIELRRVRTTDGAIEADLIINAAGGHAGALLPDLPIVPRKGHLVVTDRYPGLCHHQLVELGYLASAHAFSAASVAFNVQPRATGQLLIGSSRELAGWDGSHNRDIVRQMVARATDFLPALSALHALRIWSGFRPATRDGLPLIGPWPGEPGLWIATGHEGLGVTCALGTAQLIADQVAGRAPAIDPAPYAPARAPARSEAVHA